MGFITFGLSDHIMQGIRAAGYTIPTPIQSMAIQPALEGRDIIGCAQTGTGKTAAFVLPILHRLSADSNHQHRHPRALVLTPTRELAQQVQEAVAIYGKFLHLRSLSIYGGVNMDSQLKLLRRGVDIVIATPGRLLDHMQRQTIDLTHVEVVVLDEADRMLDMGFINDVRQILNTLPTERQTLLFSATLSGDIETLAGDFLRDPHTVQVGERHNPVEAITQHFYAVPQHAKVDLLLHAIKAENMESVLVFSRTKHGADKIARQLARSGISSIALHSNRSQSQRQHALNGFKQGRYRALVATDIAARGIDIDDISHVINFDIPHYAEDYVHRIGRTGRAGAAGDAITFVGHEDRPYLHRIERFIGKRCQVEKYPNFTPRAHAGPAHRSPMHHQPARSHGVPPWKQKKSKKRFHKSNMFEGLRKKKSPPKKMETFSSDRGGAGW